MTRFFLDVVALDGSRAARLAFDNALAEHGYSKHFVDDGSLVILPPGRFTLNTPSSAAWIENLVHGYARAAGCRVRVLISSYDAIRRAA